jgi:ELWxxDGT repeat protein
VIPGFFSGFYVAASIIIKAMKKFLLIASLIAISTAVTQAQVTQISSNKDFEFVANLGTNKAILVSSIDNHLWVSDGTAAGTTLLSSTITHEEAGITINGKVIFRGSTPTTGSELFVTDGTAAGTKLVMDINTGTTGSEISTDMAILNGYVYFTAVWAGYGREIWKTDGTPAGTSLLKDIIVGPTGSNTADGFNLFSNGNYLLFSAETLTQGTELWKSDGTSANTVLLKDINTGASSSDVKAFFKFGNIVLFQAETIATGEEIWKTDGTAAGTVLVKDIYSGPMNSTSMLSTFFYEFNGRAYFNAANGVNGEELWSTDGTEANTSMVKDIQTGPNGSFNLLFNAIKVGNKFIFASGNLFGTRNQLWQSDGTTAGTTLLQDFSISNGELPIILPAFEWSGNSYTQPLFQGNKFFFTAKTAAEGTELWVSDGTTAGTNLVKDIRTGSANGLTGASFVYTSNAFYFAAHNGSNGVELWKTDGTQGNTVMVADINVGSASADPELFPLFNNKLVFSANDGNNTAADLYVLNGTISPLPVKLLDLSAILVAKDAKIQWTTEQEINSEKFVIQRSYDGTNYENIGTVQAAGQLSIRRSYSFTDVAINSSKSIVYYRLQMVDKDGKSELTKTIFLKLAGAQWDVRLLNNPVQSTLNISMYGITGNMVLKIVDVSGKLVHTSSVKTTGNLAIPTTNLAKGMYLLTVENEQGKKVIRFIKD